MRLGEIMVPELDREMARTRRILAAVPADKMSWQPCPDLHTIGWNANHLVDLIGWTPSIVLHDAFDLAPVGQPKVQMLSLTDPAELLAKFDEYVAASRAALVNVSDETMAEMWSLKSGGQVLFTISKGECVRTWVLNHAVHHRAILAVYLRMAGVPVVPPYDE